MLGFHVWTVGCTRGRDVAVHAAACIRSVRDSRWTDTKRHSMSIYMCACMYVRINIYIYYTHVYLGPVELRDEEWKYREERLGTKKSLRNSRERHCRSLAGEGFCISGKVAVLEAQSLKCKVNCGSRVNQPIEQARLTGIRNVVSIPDIWFNINFRSRLPPGGLVIKSLLTLVHAADM